jgi:NRAMP (natural resistance-associated macrophage protein)-like metal ion transporter
LGYGFSGFVLVRLNLALVVADFRTLSYSVQFEGGSEHGYSLLYIIFIANMMAVVLQYLCIKLGVVTGRDLAMACRRHLSPPVNMAFFFLCELAIIGMSPFLTTRT